MAYQVLARKWRPLTFEEVVNQVHVKTTLVNAIKKNRIAHSYVFAGPRGVGKTTVARILARAVNCETGPTPVPCNKCASCVEIIEDRSMDVLEIDGASNRGIEDIRNIRENVKYSPVHGKYRIYIIDEVHMLTREAFNALLKTLEEPPPHVLFIFATTEFHKIPPTIYSRCQRFDFKRLTLKEIIEQLSKICAAENVSMTEDALVTLGKRAEGSLRDAESLLDQLLVSCGASIDENDVLDTLGFIREDLFFSCSDSILRKDIKAAFDITHQIFSEGHNLGEFFNGILEHFRNILLVKISRDPGMIETTEAFRKRYSSTAESFSEMDILRIINTISDAENSLKRSTQPLLRLELLMSKLFAMDRSVTVDQIMDSLETGFPNITGSKPAEVTEKTEIPAEPEIKKQIPKTEEQPELPPVVERGPVDDPELIPELSDSENVTMFKTPNGQLLNVSVKQDTIPEKPDESVSVTNSQAGDGSLNIEMIKAKWNEFSDLVQKENALTGTLLGKCKPFSITDNKVEISYQPELSFLIDTASKNKNQIKKCFSKVFEIDVNIAFIRSSTPPGERQEQMKKTTINTDEKDLKEIIEREPVIQRIMDTFEGRSIRILPH